MKEIWKNIDGYDGFYQISNNGRVKSLNRKVITKRGSRSVKERILKPNIAPNGYYYVILSNKINKTKYIHQLVANAFIKNSNCLLEVDHIDENKLNNNINNLRWMDRYSNASRSTKGKYKRRPAFLENNPNTKRVYCYDEGNLIKIYECAKIITNEFNINYSTLRNKLQKDVLFINGLKYTYNGVDID